MKIRSSNHFAQQGTALMVCLMVASVIGVTLASYLVMTQNQSVSIYRSQTWNNSIAVTEAGVEDGLQMVNELAGSLDITGWTNYTAAENWTNISPNVYYAHRTLGNDSYDAYITNLNNMPTVVAYSTLGWNFQYTTTSAAQPPTMFAATTVGTTTTSIGRRINVATAPDPLLNVAMAAIQKIDLKGNNIATDSFDSGDTNYSNGGLYPSGNPSKTKANGDVCTDDAVIDSLSVANANIKGHVKTGPGVNTISIGPNGTVGDRAWVEGGSSGIKPGWSATDFNVSFPDVVLPSVSWFGAPGSATIGGVTYSQAFNSGSGGNYTVASLSGNIYVGTNKTVRLKVTSGGSFSGNDIIRIAPGGKLLIYVQGTSFTMGGNSYVDNQTHHAENLCIYGLTTCTSISLSGNGEMAACVYAPSADYTLNGGGSSSVDFVGSSVTKTVTMNGHFNFHYDENLRRVGPARGYIPTSWGEVANH